MKYPSEIYRVFEKDQKAGKPDPEKRATHNPGEQDSDIAVQSRRPDQITYPFDSPHIREKQVIPWLCSVVYSEEYLAGGKKVRGSHVASSRVAVLKLSTRLALSSNLVLQIR
tara:strand:- start:106 stop:441 length:336 start_codon:yes stop_codon:yes gene_type:complete